MPWRVGGFILGTQSTDVLTAGGCQPCWSPFSESSAPGCHVIGYHMMWIFSLLGDTGMLRDAGLGGWMCKAESRLPKSISCHLSALNYHKKCGVQWVTRITCYDPRYLAFSYINTWIPPPPPPLRTSLEPGPVITKYTSI